MNTIAFLQAPNSRADRRDLADLRPGKALLDKDQVLVSEASVE
jgi:hypothetical protein